MVCRYVPSCPWGTRGGGRRSGLVGFLWGEPRPPSAHEVGCSETLAPGSQGGYSARPAWLIAHSRGLPEPSYLADLCGLD